MNIIEYDESAIPQESRIRVNEKLEKARETAMRILAAAPRSKRDLQERLEAKGHEREVCEELIARIEAVGLIDEHETARAIARTRFAERGRSRRAIADELSRKGFEQDAIESALEQIDSHDEYRVAKELARKRIARDRNGDRQARMRRAVGHIARKGYSPSLAIRCVSEALNEESE
ncbi:regulatory protein RecX [Timonella senegalensis]|uniref:regulatory protein RecX n=1 Tax=Timonella senegalensis TaxID=1465825 RepID=UPI0002E97863|nr:regulatory protein RecX [Timonella senegalensis]